MKIDGFDLAELRALARASSDVFGYCEWDAESVDDLMTGFRACIDGGTGYQPWIVIAPGEPVLMVALTGNGPTSEANAQFFASAKDIVLALIDRLEQIGGHDE